MALTKEEKAILTETRDTCRDLKIVLLGKNSDKGLVGQVNSNTKKTNRNTIILGAIIGSGVLGGGVTGIINLLS